MYLLTACALVLLASPSGGVIHDVKVSQTIYLTAVADVINDEFARLAADVKVFNPIMTDCTRTLNASSEVCQSCLKTVDCSGGVDGGGDGGGSGGDGGGDGGGDSGGFKPIDLIHIVNPIDFLKEPLDNIVGKLTNPVGKFVKTVGKHLVKGLKGIVGGLDDTIVDGLKGPLKGLKKLGSSLGKAVKGLTGKLGDVLKSTGKGIKHVFKGVKNTVKSLGKGVKKIFKGVGRGVKSAVKAVGKGVKHVARGIGRGVKSAAKAVGRGFKAVGRGIKKVWRGFKSLFGRRKRSAPTPEEKACMSKCPACSPFISGDQTAAYRTVCGNDVVVRNATIAAEVALFDEYFNDVSAAETDLLKQVKVNTTSNLLVHVTALIRGQYRTFSTDVAFIPLDPEAMYKNLATYIYKNYLGL